MSNRHARERAIVAAAMLDVIRELGEAYLRTARFGTHADEIALLMAVFIGTAEARPMTASKIAEHAGVPRPSAVRKLDRLAKRGVVEKIGRRYVLPASVANSAPAMRAATEARKRIRRAAAAL
ncbi:helix-turn-helix domain-containing protein [Bradyrhizobium sp. NAS80.1]|uniref:helix-turn-helix domain-containing protein n=1 Tax=Bradyrhizobium sp. NAS80.1 TaxID=1680159 RepID=UPI000AF1ADBB|nr:helix-turn-helix domain-containing protein [Bradyrhizobium sp. NAS80.1]